MQTMGDVIEHNARCHGAREALISDQRRLSWGDYANRCRQLGSALYGAGLRRRRRAAILAMNCLEYYELFGACALTGITTATVNFRLATPEMHFILENSAPEILFFEQRFLQQVSELRAALPNIHQYVCIGGDTPDWATGFESFLASGDPAGAPIRSRPDDAPYLIYTSGTTGRPKGVLHTHAGICAATEMTALASQFAGDSRVLQTSPAFHSGGIIYVNCIAWTGGTAIIHREFDAMNVLKTIAAERITHTFMVPAMLQTVLACPELEHCDVSSIRVIHSAAAPIPVPVLKEAIAKFGQVFALQYGSTETFSVCSMPPFDVVATGSDVQVGRLASVGQPLAGVGVRVVDEAGNDCATDEPGEVLVNSPSNLRRYWNNDSATVEAFSDDWFHTGDIGRFDSSGYLFLVDRKKDMIISGGENVYSREVENALLEHPAVADVAVIGIADERWGEAVHAVIVRKGERVDGDTLIQHCKSLIASYKCPKSVAFIDELPRQGTGKVDKLRLRELFG